jgi:hypothetical protein
MLAALCLAMVFAISLSSYLALCYTSLTMSTRNVVSTRCSELAETGIEQALYAQNNGDWTGWTATVGGTGTTMSALMTMTAAGLVPTVNNPLPLNFGNGTTGVVNITVSQNSFGAVASIQSQGQISLTNGSGTTTITRTLTVNGGNGSANLSSSAAPLFVNAVAATTGRVKFSNGGTLDSYNSNPNPGTYQLYNPGAPPTGNAGSSAVVVSDNVTLAGVSVRLNNAVVNGYVVGYDPTNPSTTNWLSYAGSGEVIGSTTPASTFIDSSRILSSPVPYQPIFPEIPQSSKTYSNLPLADCSGNNVLTNSCNLGSTTPPYAFYSCNAINLSGASTVVTITGPVVLYVYGAVDITNGAQIILLNPTSSLMIFEEEGSVDISGQVTNLSPIPLAKNFAILSSNNVGHTVYLAPTGPFYGVVYFPNLPITVDSAGPFYGSIVGSSVTFTNTPVIHYDVALRTPDSTPGDVAFNYLAAPVGFSGLASSVP